MGMMIRHMVPEPGTSVDEGRFLDGEGDGSEVVSQHVEGHRKSLYEIDDEEGGEGASARLQPAHAYEDLVEGDEQEDSSEHVDEEDHALDEPPSLVPRKREE